ncbi:MAG: hypothetical protein ACMXYK_04865 [Candidatus Woesearchaeota archaeon]
MRLTLENTRTRNDFYIPIHKDMLTRPLERSLGEESFIEAMNLLYGKAPQRDTQQLECEGIVCHIRHADNGLCTVLSGGRNFPGTLYLSDEYCVIPTLEKNFTQFKDKGPIIPDNQILRVYSKHNIDNEKARKIMQTWGITYVNKALQSLGLI